MLTQLRSRKLSVGGCESEVYMHGMHGMHAWMMSPCSGHLESLLKVVPSVLHKHGAEYSRAIYFDLRNNAFFHNLIVLGELTDMQQRNA